MIVFDGFTIILIGVYFILVSIAIMGKIFEWIFRKIDTIFERRQK